MIKCKDCRFGSLKVLPDNESAPCLRVDNEECPITMKKPAKSKCEMLREGENK